MKAAVWRGLSDLSIQDVPQPNPSEGEVLIKTKAVGICGTDLEIYDGRFKQSKPPLIIGHEGGGVVEAVGAGVSGGGDGSSPPPGSGVAGMGGSCVCCIGPRGRPSSSAAVWSCCLARLGNRALPFVGAFP